MLQKVDCATTAPRRSLRKTFHLNEILSVTTGLQLSAEGSAGIHRLIAFMMETDADEGLTLENADVVRDCIEQQLPFLAEMQMQGLADIIRQNPSPDNPYLQVWLEMQQLRYGEDHTLIPYSRWQRLQQQKLNAAQ